MRVRLIKPVPGDQTDPIRAALDVAGFGFLLFDANQTLTHHNQPAKRLLPALAAQLQPGVRVDALFGVVEGGAGGVSVVLRDPALASVQVTLTGSRTPDGGLLVVVVERSRGLIPQPEHIALLESSPSGVWEWDVEAGDLRVDDRWLDMLGRSRAALAPLTFEMWRRWIHPSDHEAFRLTLDEVVQRRTDMFNLMFRMRHAAGHWIWIRSRGRVQVWSETGAALVMAGVHLDVTEQKTVEQRLEQILEGAQVGTWQHDERSGHNRIDARWADMLGYTPDELLLLTQADLTGMLHPDDWDSLSRDQAQRRQDGAWKFDNEIRLRHKDGHWVWILSRGRVTDWDEAGEPLTTSGVHIDISQRKSLEQALARERDFLAALMETSISGILALDSNGMIIFANREAEKVLGRPLAELLGRTCYPAEWQLTDGNLVPLELDKMPPVMAIRSGQTQRGDRIGLNWPDGSRRMMAVNAAPLTVPGVDVTVVCSITDITDAVAAEATLHAAIERAEAGNRAKSEFLANMSHEIRTPLNGVVGMADVLGATLIRPDQRAMIETIQQSGGHLLQILNDILDLSKIESGLMALDMQPFLPADLARRVEALHGPRAQSKGVELSVLCDVGAARARMGDAKRVLQVLHNLIGNAVKFTETGEVRLTMVAQCGAPLLIEVTDTGIGMTAEQGELVFHDFVQADGSITRRFGGTGLGLPIVRKLVTMMGGVIRLDTAQGRGTRVQVELPLPEVEPIPQPVAVMPRTLAGLRALVAEDNGTNRIILRSMLATLGIDIAMVEDGDEAVGMWQPDRFDILLLDISMPRRDGLSALHDIRALALAAGVPCPPALAVTANAMTHHVADYLKAGFAGCVSKPMRLQDLAAAIAGAVNVQGAR